MQAGKLRHRIEIQELVPVRDPVTLEFGEPEWVTRWPKCPARVEDLSAKDFIAAQAATVGPPLADDKSGLDYLTILVEKGVKDG